MATRSGLNNNGRAIRWLISFAAVFGGLVLACGGGGDHDGPGHDHGAGPGHGGGGGSPSTFSIGGTVVGLAGSGLILRNNGSDDLAVTQNGAFTFPKRLTGGSGYSVAVAMQPSGPAQNCAVSQGIGSVRDRDITSVSIACTSVPLTLTSSVPASGAVDVPVTAPLVLKFSAALNGSTVTASSVTLNGPSGTVPLAVSASSNILTVTPAGALAVQTAYTLTVSTAVRGAAGEQLSAAVTLNFTTAGKPWTALIGRSSTLPAQTEGYKCTRVVAPSDLYITGFRAAAGPGLRFAHVAIPPDNLSLPLGDFDCVATIQGKVIYAAATGTDDFLFPTGVGIHVLAGQSLLLVMDIVNDTATVNTENDQILVQTGAAGDVSTPAELILLGTSQISIPATPNGGTPGAPYVANSAVTLLHDRQLLALLPLMRTRGVHQTVSLQNNGSPDTLVVLDSDFDPSRQTFHPLSNVFATASTHLFVACSYVNNGPDVIGFGESQSDELCLSALYTTPSYDEAFPSGFNGISF